MPDPTAIIEPQHQYQDERANPRRVDLTAEQSKELGNALEKARLQINATGMNELIVVVAVHKNFDKLSQYQQVMFKETVAFLRESEAVAHQRLHSDMNLDANKPLAPQIEKYLESLERRDREAFDRLQKVILQHLNPEHQTELNSHLQGDRAKARQSLAHHITRGLSNHPEMSMALAVSLSPEDKHLLALHLEVQRALLRLREFGVLLEAGNFSLSNPQERHRPFEAASKAQGWYDVGPALLDLYRNRLNRDPALEKANAFSSDLEKRLDETSKMLLSIGAAVLLRQAEAKAAYAEWQEQKRDEIRAKRKQILAHIPNVLMDRIRSNEDFQELMSESDLFKSELIDNTEALASNIDHVLQMLRDVSRGEINSSAEYLRSHGSNRDDSLPSVALRQELEAKTQRKEAEEKAQKRLEEIALQTKAAYYAQALERQKNESAFAA